MAATAAAVLLLFPRQGAAAQARRAWLVRAELGWYEMGSGDGVAIGAHVARSFGDRLHLDLGLTDGPRAEGNFTALELGFEVHLLPAASPNPFIAAGTGLMFEPGNTFSNTRYVSVGLQASLSRRSMARATVRRGNHRDFEIDYTFAGPHIVSLGWVWQF